MFSEGRDVNLSRFRIILIKSCRSWSESLANILEASTREHKEHEANIADVAFLPLSVREGYQVMDLEKKRELNDLQEIINSSELMKLEKVVQDDD